MRPALCQQKNIDETHDNLMECGPKGIEFIKGFIREAHEENNCKKLSLIKMDVNSGKKTTFTKRRKNQRKKSSSSSELVTEGTHACQVFDCLQITHFKQNSLLRLIFPENNNGCLAHVKMLVDQKFINDQHCTTVCWFRWNECVFSFQMAMVGPHPKPRHVSKNIMKET